MKNLMNRLLEIENRLNPKTTLFRCCGTDKNGEIIILSESKIPRFKNSDEFNMIIGREICRDDDLEEGRAKYGILSRDKNSS